MSVNKVLPGSGFGYVRAVFSGRCRGYAAPVDLLRCHLRGVGRCAVRSRLAADFGGYLVTDAAPAVVSLFSGHRGAHGYGILRECVTSEMKAWWCRSDDVQSGPIDAPELLPAGSMRSAEDGGFSGVVQRWRGESSPLSLAEREPAGVGLPVWRDRLSGRVVVVGDAMNFAGGLMDEFRFEPDGGFARSLDAPVFLPAGAMRAGVAAGEVCANVLTVSRPGWWK